MADNKSISKVTLSGVTYDIKDNYSRDHIATLENIVKGGVQLVVVSALPSASAETVGKIYLVSHTHSAEAKDIYDEYLTIIGGTTEAPTYSWEKIGNTDIDLSGYAKKNHTHTVKSNVTATEKSITPEGDITLPSFTSTVTPTTTNEAVKVTNAGTGYTMTDGGVSQAADTKSTFATEGVTASYTEATETLVFDSASTSNAVTASGAVTYTNPVLSGSLPTFTTLTVMTGATVATAADTAATFAGKSVDVTPTLTNNQVTTSADADPTV